MSEKDNTELKPAEENPWYVLATLYGEPSSTDYMEDRWLKENTEINKLNRESWNNYFNTGHKNQKFIDEISEKFAKRTKVHLPNPYNEIDFSGTHFRKGLNLSGFVLPKIRFEGSVFEDGLLLKGAKFTTQARFNGVQLKGNNDFYEAYFSEYVDFTNATFADNKISRFFLTIFKGGVEFSDAKFCHQLLFLNCIFEQSCNFTNTKFRKHYPNFTNTILREKITISAKEECWPDPKNCKQNPEEAKATCEVLREQMEAQGLHEQAHFFFRHEMHFARKTGSFWQAIPNWFFYFLSDYGYSILRPVLGLLSCWITGALIYFDTTKLTFGGAMGLSVSNLLQITGLQRVYWSDFIECLPWGLKFLGGLQTLLAIPLLFLLLLGLRNRFRLK